MTKNSIFEMMLLLLLFIIGVVIYLPPPNTRNDILLICAIQKIMKYRNITNKHAFLSKLFILDYLKNKKYIDNTKLIIEKLN